MNGRRYRFLSQISSTNEYISRCPIVNEKKDRYSALSQLRFLDCLQFSPEKKGGCLMWGPRCQMSNLRNNNIPCRYNFNFKIVECHMLNLGNVYLMLVIFSLLCQYASCRIPIF